MHLDFSTFCLISVPGFLVGIMAGKFVAGDQANYFRHRLGITWKIIGGIAQVCYILLTLVTMVIMVIYLVNSNESSQPWSYWITITAGLWMTYNLIYEFVRIYKQMARQA